MLWSHLLGGVTFILLVSSSSSYASFLHLQKGYPIKYSSNTSLLGQWLCPYRVDGFFNQP